MTVVITVARLATMWRNFATESGLRIETAFDNIPRVIYPAQAPFVVIIPGEGRYNYDQYGEQVVSETRQYRCVLGVSIATLGNLETGQDVIEPYFSAVRDYFAARPGLEDDTATDVPGNRQTVVAKARILSDSGYFIFAYPSGLSDTEGEGLFHAVEFLYEVEEIAHIQYED